MDSQLCDAFIPVANSDRLSLSKKTRPIAALGNLYIIWQPVLESDLNKRQVKQNTCFEMFYIRYVIQLTVNSVLFSSFVSFS